MPKNDCIVSNTNRHAEIRCGTCGNVSTVEVDEDGAALPATKCSQEGCQDEMCGHEDCLVNCDYCDLPVCEKHCKRVAVPIFDGAVEMEWQCDNCRESCICPELENLSDGPEDSLEPRPACPVHGTVLYGGETITHQELQRQADEEAPGCPI